MAGVIHVSSADNEMGCLRVYSGSHKLGRIQMNRGQLPEDLREQYSIENATVVEAQAGDVVFFDYRTLHGSMPNRSSRVRKTVLVQMHAGDDRMDETGPAHPYSGIVLRGWNHAARKSLGNKLG